MTAKPAESIVLYDSPEAATFRTVEGWVSRANHFFGKDGEHLARYDGCTHRKCETCDAIVSKTPFTICDDCRRAKQTARYLAMPIVEWGDAMAYDYFTDEWFSDAESLIDHYDDAGLDIADAQLVAGEPIYAREIDPLDIYDGDLPEDSDLPDDVTAAFAVLNATLKSARAVLSWRPVDKRILPPVVGDAEVTA